MRKLCLEVWKDINGYEGLYEVSNLGRVRSVDRIIESNNQHCVFSRIIKGCILRPSKDRYNYLRVSLSKNGSNASFTVHRLVLEAFICSRPKDMEARHINGSSSDCRLCNLKWGTKLENGEDKKRHGTAVGINRGSKNKNTKLSISDIKAIRRDSRSLSTIGRDYGVTKQTVYGIKKRLTWNYV